LEKCFVVSSCGTEFEGSVKNFQDYCELPKVIDNLTKNDYSVIHNHTNETPPSYKDIEVFLKSKKIKFLHTLTREYDYILEKTEATACFDEKSLNIFNFLVKKIEVDVKNFMQLKLDVMQKNINFLKTNKSQEKIDLILHRLDIEFKENVIEHLAKLYNFNLKKQKWT